MLQTTLIVAMAELETALAGCNWLTYESNSGKEFVYAIIPCTD